MNKVNNEIIEWKYCRWLVLSSFLMMFPCVYSYYHKMYFYTVTTFATSLVSANYWRKPRYDYRRNLDLIFSKLSFIIYFSNGIIYIYESKNVVDFTKINMILTLFGIIYCYYFSTKLYKLKNNNWWKYHILFHLFVTYEKMIILHLLSFRVIHIKKIEYY